MEEKAVDTKEHNRPQREYGHKYHLLNTIRNRGKPLGENEELVGTDPEKRNWKGIIIAVLVILIVFAFIGIAVYFVTPANDKTELGEPFQLENLFDKDFKVKKLDSRWLPGRDVLIYRSRDGEVLARYMENDTARLIMDNSTFIQLESETYFVSEDLQFVLIAYKVQKIYRHSFLAEYKIYNSNAIEPAELIKFPHDNNGSWQDKKLQYAGWSTRGHALTFVYENNLYYQMDPYSAPVKVTQTGSDTVLNGVPDWLYEEEIFRAGSSHWFSPASTYMCYTQINDSAVPVYSFPWYGSPHQVNSGFKTIHYPKAGDEGSNILPVIKLYVLHTGSSMSGTHKELQPPTELANQEHYVTQVRWLSDERLVVVWSNRPQNKSFISYYNARTEEFYLNYIQKSTGGWVEIPKIIPVEGGNRYVTILPKKDYNSEYFKHTAVTSVSDTDNKESKEVFLTQGSYDVTDLVGYDQHLNNIYYISTNGDPRTRHLFRVSLPTRSHTKPGSKLPSPQCITCHDANCSYVRAEFSPSGKHYVLHCDGPNIPYTLLRSVELEDKDKDQSDVKTEKETVLEDNAPLREKLNKVAQPVVENFTIQADDGHDILVRVKLPPVLNKEHITLYPMLVHTYGAPGTQKITNAFSMGWEWNLVTYHTVISVEVDGRGSGGRGERIQHAVYKQLGTLEVQDQIRVAKYLRENYSFIDKERIAIWGWSYGGFVAVHALGDRDSDVFTCGIAVAPVTDWRYYDAAYTEKYMGLALRDSRHYEDADVSKKAAFFKGKQLLLVHGTADDNVHYQHTAQFAKALTAEDVDFRTQVYTDENHSLEGDKTQRHLYRTMTSFLRQGCWGGGKPRELHNGEYTDLEYNDLTIR